MQSDQRGARSVGVGLSCCFWLAAIELCPTAVVALLSRQFLGRRADIGRRSRGLFERQQPEDAIFSVFGWRFGQPVANLLAASRDSLRLFRRSEDGEATKAEIRRCKWRRFRRWPVRCVVPVIAILVVQ